LPTFVLCLSNSSKNNCCRMCTNQNVLSHIFQVIIFMLLFANQPFLLVQEPKIPSMLLYIKSKRQNSYVFLQHMSKLESLIQEKRRCQIHDAAIKSNVPPDSFVSFSLWSSNESTIKKAVKYIQEKNETIWLFMINCSLVGKF
jgi:hypothetical protein